MICDQIFGVTTAKRLCQYYLDGLDYGWHFFNSKVFFKKFYWSIVDLQCCANFCYMAKDSAMYIRIHTFFYFYFILFYFLLFRAAPRHMEVPRLRSNQSYSYRPMSQLQQLGIRAMSVTHTTAHGNARSLTHWVRPGIEPASSRMPVRFISTEPRWELPLQPFGINKRLTKWIRKDWSQVYNNTEPNSILSLSIHSSPNWPNGTCLWL